MTKTSFVLMDYFALQSIHAPINKALSNVIK